MTQTSASTQKCIKKLSFWTFTTICHIYTWVDFVCILTCLIFLKSPWWSLEQVAQIPWAQKKQERKTYKKFLWPIKNFLKYFMGHQYMLQIFNSLRKKPFYIFNVNFHVLLLSKTHLVTFKTNFVRKESEISNIF